MRRWWRMQVSFLGMASANLLRFRLRTVVVLLCLLAAAVPLLTALAMQEGLKRQALFMLEAGPDLLVAGDDFGRPCSVPLSWTETVVGSPGVERVIPRVVGRVMIEDLPALLVGFGSAMEGGIPRLQRGELAPGAAIARHFGLSTGDNLSIALPVEGPERFRYRTFTVAAILDTPQGPVWSAGMIVGHFQDLQDIFNRPGMATELLVWCRSGYEERISLRLAEDLGPGAKIQDRAMMEGYFHGGFDRRAGAFLVYFLGALVISIPVLALASGLGMPARRREVAVLKSMGWETSEVLLLQMMESVVTAVAGASLAVVVALVWLKFGSAWPLNEFLLPGAGELPPFRLPYLMNVKPVLLVYVYSISVTASGAVAAAWRAASVDPGTVLLGGGG